MFFRKHLKVIVSAIIAFCIGSTAIHVYYGNIFYFNTTPAGPRGIYRISFEKNSPLQKGDYVIVRLSSTEEDKNIIMLKRVAGVSGETYEVNPYAMLMDGTAYPINKEFPIDHKLQPAKYTIPKDSVLLLCNYDSSMDSRYFGPFSKEQIVNKVVPILSFE